MRLSSRSRRAPVPSPSPPRARAASGGRARHRTLEVAGRVAHDSSTSKPEHQAHGGDPGGRPVVVDVAAERGDVVAPSRRDEHAELAALGRFERPERPPQQGHGVDEHLVGHRRDPRIDDRQQGDIVDEHGAAAGEEALDEAGAVGGGSPRGQRPPDPLRHRVGVPRARVVEQPRRPAAPRARGLPGRRRAWRGHPAARRGGRRGRASPTRPAAH